YRHPPVVPPEADDARRAGPCRCPRGGMGSRRPRPPPRSRAGARARVVVRDVIAFRQVDARYPFLWEDASQPAGRWHGDGEGPAHYFADTPDGAWAEFLRHEEITDAEDLPTIRRQMWAVDIGESALERVTLPEAVLTGGPDTYPDCQSEARALRLRGVRR